MAISTSIWSTRGISEDGEKKPDEDQGWSSRRQKKERKKKKKEEIAIQRKQVFSEQAVYLCLSVGEWVLLLWQECLPVRDH
jgi:hypothetical protein